MPALSRQFNKLCDVEDFDDPQLRAKLREIIAPGHEPETELRRKYWEYGMLGLYLEEAGVLNEDTEVLAVAAGHEEPLYWLANRVGKVVATDIYGDGGFAVDGREADATMLTDPDRWAPYEYRRDHLDVQHMNAMALDFPDDSFDVVFSLSSIEHFGLPADVQRAAAEMARVLKPGGHLIIVTECLVGRHPLDPPLVQYAIKLATFGRVATAARPNKRVIDAFTPKELERNIIAPTGLTPVQPLDTHVSEASYDNLIKWVGAGELHPKTGKDYPHVLLQAAGSPWTSAFLALR